MARSLPEHLMMQSSCTAKTIDMMRSFNRSIIVAVLACAGCSGGTFDTDSASSFGKSVGEAQNRLPQNERSAFAEGLTVLHSRSTHRSQEDAREDVSRNSVEEIVSVGVRSLLEKHHDELQSLQWQLTRLQEQDAKASAFKVSKALLEFGSGTFGRADRMVSLRVHNGLQASVSRVFVKVKAESSGRAVPWIRDVFNFSIAGGIEPGEKYEGSFRMNMFSGWSSVPSDRDDIVLSVEAYKVLDHEGETIFDIPPGEEYQERQLWSLGQDQENASSLLVKIEALQRVIRELEAIDR